MTIEQIIQNIKTRISAIESYHPEEYALNKGILFELKDLLSMIEKDKPSLHSNLEKAAEKYASMHPLCNGKPAKASFIAGAEWQKEQMMKDTYVESKIVEDGRIELEGNPLPCLNPIILLPYPQFKPGDKVRIVVLKEEEK